MSINKEKIERVKLMIDQKRKDIDQEAITKVVESRKLLLKRLVNDPLINRLDHLRPPSFLVKVYPKARKKNKRIDNLISKRINQIRTRIK
ncbi:MAG TPA: hypothetical protein VIK81_03365 [Patescibacteria group bacterium]